MTREQLFSRLKQIPTNLEKVLVLTHTDLDGAGAAVLVTVAFPNATVDIKHCNNNEMSDEILKAIKEESNKYDFILASDISLTALAAEEADLYIKNNFLLFDHHPTAEHLNKYNWACVYGGKIEDSARAVYYDSADDWHTSATGLLYDYFAYKELEAILKYPKLTYFAFAVSAYDTWDWKITFCKKDSIKELNTLCFIYGLDRFERSMRLRITMNEDLITRTDKMLFELEQERVDRYIDRLKDNIIIGSLEVLGRTYSYAGCISTDYVGPVFEYLRDTYPNYDLLIVNTGTSISMRTNTGVDLAVIAKHFNGGGHTAAGGFPIKLEDRCKILTIPFVSSEKTVVFC